MGKGLGLGFKLRYGAMVAFFNKSVQIVQELFRGLSRHKEGSRVVARVVRQGGGPGLWQDSSARVWV